MIPRPQVVVVGAGFGGLAAARGLAGADVDVTIVDRNNFHYSSTRVLSVIVQSAGSEK